MKKLTLVCDVKLVGANLSLGLLHHGLSVARLHLCFGGPGVTGGRLAWQTVRKLHEEKLLLFAVIPHLQ